MVEALAVEALAVEALMVDIELTVAEAAHLSGLTDRTIRNWINDGKLPARSEPSGRKVRTSDLMAVLIEKGYAAAPMEGVLEPEGSSTAPSAETEPDATEPSEPAGTSGNQLPIIYQTMPLLLSTFIEQLESERARSDRLQRENMELAARVGFLQGRLMDADHRLAEASKPPPEPECLSENRHSSCATSWQAGGV